MKKIIKNSQKAFTLIELLVVIAVLGVLAAGVLTAINPVKRIQQANDTKIKNDIGQIAQGMQAFYTSSSTSTGGTPYYPGAISDIVGPTGELKITPTGATYTITGVDDAAADCAGTTKKCSEITISAPLNETNQGYWCWQSSTGKAGRVAAAPAAKATSCGAFL